MLLLAGYKGLVNIISSCGFLLIFPKCIQCHLFTYSEVPLSGQDSSLLLRVFFWADCLLLTSRKKNWHPSSRVDYLERMQIVTVINMYTVFLLCNV